MTLHDQLAANGYAIVPDVLTHDAVDQLLAAVSIPALMETLTGRGGARDLFALVPAVAELASSPPLRRLAEDVLGSDAMAVRAVFFDKTPGANWKVAWHQDLTIAVRERRDVPGFAHWSVKAGIPHVQPPATILEQMVTLRVHLDDCDTTNGPVRVLPGSHAHGRLGAAEVDALVADTSAVTCCVARGSVLAMRPLLLHASSVAERAAHRRVIHLEYAAAELPGGLEWYERVGRPQMTGLP